MDNKLDDLFSQTPSTEPEADTAPVEVEEPQTQVEEVEEPQTEAEQAPTEEPAKPEAKTDDRKNWVPVSALQDERSKARTAIEEANSLRQRIAALEAAQKTTPDPYDDPQGFVAAQQQATAQMVAQQVAYQNLNYSRQRAAQKYGEEMLNEVAEWAGEQASLNPNFEATLLSQADPAEWVIAEKKRNDELKSFQTDREAFLRSEWEKMGLTTTAPVAAVATPPAKKLAGPASIVTAKSRDTNEAIKPADAFDAIFGKSRGD